MSWPMHRSHSLSPDGASCVRCGVVSREYAATYSCMQGNAEAEDVSRDPAEEACYDIQKACWEFEDAIKRCHTNGRLAFIDGMLSETKKRVELLIVQLAARQTELES